GLIVTCLRDACRVNLGVARIGEVRALLVRLPVGRDRATHGVGGEVEDVDVTAGAEADGIGSVGLQLAGDQVAAGYAAGNAVDHDQIEHLAAVVHLDRAELYLA